MSRQIKGDWLLYLVWVIVFVLVMIFTLTHELESTSFFGITESREIVISSKSSVEIQNIDVIEGQSVGQGRELVKLISPDLTIKINQISHQLDGLKAQKGVNKNELISKINQLKAEKRSLSSEANNKIRQLENQYNINKALTSELKSISSFDNSKELITSNPIFLEIESLREELALNINPIDIQIELNQELLDASESPIEIQVARLVKELDLLQQERDNLTINAQISGIIGSVNYKAGEKVAPHNPILTLHTKNPSHIKGYIYEDVYTKISVGMQVNVTSLTDAKTKITGSVVGVGSRIVEYPIRLRKHPEMQQWGREIMIKIPLINPLILGEKVIISAVDQKKSLF
ncbi:MAG: HlyD family efflux transporter periplasmic adaptor subunit [Calditrichaeota bacterium]|jgi:multidrug resistance efflux pump|nr:HlyD family efflux transporter periplasmic adaptor subunit [Calditrichota bacterium]MBT7616947.1 HlyD family efflux transporter periplasmic adaptor subunit [Calditrichota bacterium]